MSLSEDSLQSLINSRQKKEADQQKAVDLILSHYDEPNRPYVQILINGYSKFSLLLDFWLKMEIVKFYEKDSKKAVYVLKRIVHEMDDWLDKVDDKAIEGLFPGDFKPKIKTLKRDAERRIDYIQYKAEQQQPDNVNNSLPPTILKRNCDYCGKEFYTGNKNKKYCSNNNKCRNSARQKKHRNKKTLESLHDTTISIKK